MYGVACIVLYCIVLGVALTRPLYSTGGSGSSMSGCEICEFQVIDYAES